MFNRPETVPYFTVWFCVKIDCQHTAIVSLQIIFFKISQQIAKHLPFDQLGTVDLSVNDDLEIKTEPPN